MWTSSVILIGGIGGSLPVVVVAVDNRVMLSEYNHICTYIVLHTYVCAHQSVQQYLRRH